MNLFWLKGQKSISPASVPDSFRTSTIRCSGAASTAGREHGNNLRRINYSQTILLCWEANPFRAQRLMSWATNAICKAGELQMTAVAEAPERSISQRRDCSPLSSDSPQRESLPDRQSQHSEKMVLRTFSLEKLIKPAKSC